MGPLGVDARAPQARNRVLRLHERGRPRRRDLDAYGTWESVPSTAASGGLAPSPPAGRPTAPGTGSGRTRGAGRGCRPSRGAGRPTTTADGSSSRSLVLGAGGAEHPARPVRAGARRVCGRRSGVVRVRHGGRGRLRRLVPTRAARPVCPVVGPPGRESCALAERRVREPRVRDRRREVGLRRRTARPDRHRARCRHREAASGRRRRARAAAGPADAGIAAPAERPHPDRPPRRWSVRWPRDSPRLRRRPRSRRRWR